MRLSDENSLIGRSHSREGLTCRIESCSRHGVEDHREAALEVEVVIKLLRGLLSGSPSKNLSVPSRVSTLSGVVMAAGMSVVIFIFGESAR